METGLAFEPWAKPGDRLIAGRQAGRRRHGRRQGRQVPQGRGRRLPRAWCWRHPLAALDRHYGFQVPMLAGDHVTDDAGTGFVHTAPGHGADDYVVWLAHGHSRDPRDRRSRRRLLSTHVPLFGGPEGAGDRGQEGRQVRPGQRRGDGQADRGRQPAGPRPAGALLSALLALQGAGDLPQHARSGSSAWTSRWRTPRTAAAPCARPRWRPSTPPPSIPQAGKNRIRSMVESRPDWLISRQRAWGSPLAMFVDKETGQPLHDEEVNAPHRRRRSPPRAPTPGSPGRQPTSSATTTPSRYEKIEDILDVWFDSGSTHAFALEGRRRTPAGPPTSTWKAPTSTAAGSSPRCWKAPAPAAARPTTRVLTHGFTMDENGEKMSKSKGNTVEPRGGHPESGRRDPPPVGGDDRLRRRQPDRQDRSCRPPSDAYRKLRNTVRYLLGALAGFTRPRRSARRRCRRWSGSSCTACGSSTARCAPPTRATVFQDVIRAADRVLPERAVGAVLRHPPRRPLLRPARRRPPPRRAAR